MSNYTDSFDEKVKKDRRTRSRHYRTLTGEVVMSDAFKEIASHGPSLTAYIQIIFRQPLPPKAKERKRLEKLRLWPRPPEEFSFPLREAPHHGLTQKGLVAGLRRLHEVGIIDRTHAGSALRKGDFAQYILSERWRDWGKPTFRAIPWPKAENLTKNEEKERRDERGRFKQRRGRKFLVDAISASTESPLTAESAATDAPVAAKSAVNGGGNGDLVAAESAVYLYLNQSIEKYPRDGQDERIEGEAVDPKELKVEEGEIRGRGGATTSSPPKQYRPPKAEMRENVAEILRQRPDPRAGDRRFISSLTDQLQAIQHGRLDPERVRFSLEDWHGLDTWTTDLLFAIGGLS